MKIDQTIIYLVRHGETMWNKEKRMQSRTDIPLSPIGVRQVERLSKKLSNIQFAAVYSSDLTRAVATAEIIRAGRDIPQFRSLLLREKEYGILEGKRLSDLQDFQTRSDMLVGRKSFMYKYHPSMESDEEVAERIFDYLRSVSSKHYGEKILAISHSSAIRAFLLRIGFANDFELPHGSVLNTAYVVLQSTHQGFTVVESSNITLISK